MTMGRRVAGPRSAAAVALVIGLVLVPAVAQPQEDPDIEAAVAVDVSDTIAVVKDDEALGTADVAVRISQVTLADDTGSMVLVGRDDDFADAMASAVLQDGAPLLLVPPAGPVPDAVAAEIERLGATRAVLLGGEAAVRPAVADELTGMGLAVQRRAGPSRIETAVDIARQDAPSADIAILARAFPAPGAADPTQAFADSIAAGGLAAETGWPVLLTQTEVLTGSTREHLIASQVRSVMIVGGTAAVGEAVADELRQMGMEVQRIAGASRADTAVEVAKTRGAASADDVARTILVDGTDEEAWAAGFAAAGHSAAFDAPILLASGDDLPAETAAWLDAEAAPAVGSETPVLTCATRAAACDRARERLRLPPRLRILVRPVPGSAVQPGQAIGIRIDGLVADDVRYRVGGDCVVAAMGALDDVGRARTTVAAGAASGPCRVVWQVGRPGGTVHTGALTYAVAGTAVTP